MRRLLIRTSVILTAALLATFWSRSGVATMPVAQSGAFALQAPPFVAVAAAAPAVTSQNAAGQIQNQAGISAYFKAPSAIDLTSSALLNHFRGVEQATNTYIIGSVGVPDYDPNDDAHVYVSANGWVLAYYLKNEPVAKIFDWKHWDGGTSIPSKLDRVLAVVASGIGISTPALTYYHFQYPNATNLMLAGDQAKGTTDSFEITLPGNFLYYERSWSLSCNPYQAILELDGVKLADIGPGQTQAVLNQGQLLPDTSHTLKVTGATFWGGSTGSAVLALIYRVQ